MISQYFGSLKKLNRIVFGPLGKLAILGFFLVRCTHPVVKTDSSFTASSEFLVPSTQGCLFLMDQFCEELHSPTNLGNITLVTDKNRIVIQQGRTQNGFSLPYFEYSLSKLKYRHRFPKDFLKILKQRGFFNKMEEILGRKSKPEMNLDERLSSIRDEAEVNAIWSSTLSEVVLLRMEKKSPGFSKIPEILIPTELIQESSRVRARLLSAIDQALWEEHPNWRKTEDHFKEVRDELLKFILFEPGIPKKTKEKWLNRVQNVKLILPGADPSNRIADCSQTENNAYYFEDKNQITVCAGDFNTEEIKFTLAHELAHSFDFSNSLEQFEKQSELGQSLLRLRSRVCEEKPVSCDVWRDFKTNLDSNLEKLSQFESDLPNLQRCLRGSGVKATPDSQYYNRLAEQEVQRILNSAAERNLFLKLSQKELPYPDGTRRKNPAYLNPCGTYLWPPHQPALEDDFQLLLSFSYEYSCAESTLTSPARLSYAIGEAKKIQQKLLARHMSLEGEFSDHEQSVADHYSLSPDERFADFIASHVFARLLQNKSNIGLRRADFLSNQAWQCSRPGLRKYFPEENLVEKRYSSDAHSEEALRRKEVLIEPIRDALECKKDFSLDECRF